MRLKNNKLYCDDKLNIVAKSDDVIIQATYNVRIGPVWAKTTTQNYIEIENEGQTTVQTNESFITDLFELQTKFESVMFIRSTAILKKSIDDKYWYLDKYNIVKNKNNQNIISIAINKIKIRKKIIDIHDELWKALRKYK